MIEPSLSAPALYELVLCYQGDPGPRGLPGLDGAPGLPVSVYSICLAAVSIVSFPDLLHFVELVWKQVYES